MAVLKQRLHRKNSSGTYDIVYLEGIANNIKMSDSDTTLLSSKISSMDTAIAGKQPKGSYAAANHNHNGVYQPVGSYATTTQLNEVKTSVSNGKSAVASAITDKGVSTSATASFNTMANNIRSITSISSPKLIPGNILWSIGTDQYPAYTPPIFAQDPECIIVGHKILSNYNMITGQANTITSNYRYYFYNIITGSITVLFIPEYSYTGAIPNAVKNGDPYIIILSCPNSTGYDHKVIRLE